MLKVPVVHIIIILTCRKQLEYANSPEGSHDNKVFEDNTCHSKVYITRQYNALS